MGAVYLDHAAATPLDERVFLAMQPYFSEVFYNPSSSYEGGRVARKALEDAREDIALILGAKSSEIIFSAGATESINLALGGLLQQGGHAVIGATEHAAVRETVSAFPHSIAKSDNTGLVTPEAVKSEIRDDTIVVSIAMADNEFGTIQPLSDIAMMLDGVRAQRLNEGNKTPLYLHSDGSQGAGALDLKVSRLKIDMLTLNAAKCYGPKQVGLLWMKSSVRLKPLVLGGNQERGLRSGTENIAGAVGFAKALELAQKTRHQENDRLAILRDYLVRVLVEKVDGLVVDGNAKKHLPGHLHIHLAGLDAERVVFHLDNKSVYVATGAACAANKSARSPALEAIGMTPTQADGSLRLTLGKLNDETEIRAIAPIIAEAINLERLL